jgi:hypothetical protein
MHHLSRVMTVEALDLFLSRRRVDVVLYEII